MPAYHQHTYNESCFIREPCATRHISRAQDAVAMSASSTLVASQKPGYL